MRPCAPPARRLATATVAPARRSAVRRGPPHPHAARPALLLECDGVALDAHADAHRVAFNRAFSELGMDCTSWPPALYADLLRGGDGTGEGLVALYFNTVGWPTMLATADRGPFAHRVHRLKAEHLAAMVDAGAVPLRKGVLDLVDEALADGAAVGLLACSASRPDDRLAAAALAALGPEREVAVFDVPSTQDAAASEAGGADLGFVAAAARQKAAAAARVATGASAGGGVMIDPALRARAEGSLAPAPSPAWLAACAASLGVAPPDVAVAAASGALLRAARGAGAVALAVPSSRGGRGAYPDAHAVCDGFGPGGGATWRRAAALIDANRARQQGGA